MIFSKKMCFSDFSGKILSCLLLALEKTSRPIAVIFICSDRNFYLFLYFQTVHEVVQTLYVAILDCSKTNFWQLQLNFVIANNSMKRVF